MSLELVAKEIFKTAVDNGASDVHIKPGTPPKMRANGFLQPVPGYENVILTSTDTQYLIHETMNTYYQSRFDDNKYGLDYSYTIPGVGRFRMSAYRTREADACVGRKLLEQPKTLGELKVSPKVSEFADLPNGLIIIVGATGSGKSSTMAGVVDYINKNKSVNIISIEDPIEIEYTDNQASIAQREVGIDVGSYPEALKAALRQDPDVILIGEIRELETLKTAIVAADTGHLVITTLHTGSAAETIQRMLNMYPEGERDDTRLALASSLRGVVGQRLVRTVDGVTRVAVNEIMVNTPEISSLITNPDAKQEDYDKIISSRLQGMNTFDQHLEDLLRSGTITLKTAKNASVHPWVFDKIAEMLPAVVKEPVVSKIVPPAPPKPHNIPVIPVQPPSVIGEKLMSEPNSPAAPPVAIKKPSRPHAPKSLFDL